MPFVSPGSYSKAELDRAGNRIRAGSHSLADLSMLENWRAAHLYVINTFQASLRLRRNRSLSADYITIAQRLKRRPTIIDKLSRESGMSLSRMHDIAGCRIIFPDIDSLISFREGVLTSRAGHELVGGRYRYDYMSRPKNSGYRGIHDVYKYCSQSRQGSLWNGLRIEIQYRTVFQHSWATAVEISDIVNATRIKFSDAGESLKRLFLICSEIVSRYCEGVRGYLHDVSSSELFNEFDYLEGRLHAIQQLRALTSSEFQSFAKSSKLFILINFTSGPEAGTFRAEGFSESAKAISRYSKLEQELQNLADVVLVGAGQQEAIKLAYTNYFQDASLFLRHLDFSINQLRADLA